MWIEGQNIVVAIASVFPSYGDVSDSIVESDANMDFIVLSPYAPKVYCLRSHSLSADGENHIDRNVY